MDDRVKAYLEYLQEKKLNWTKILSQTDKHNPIYADLIDAYSKLYECEACVRRLENLNV